MIISPEWLLVGAVAGVGVLHTIVPDHWVPITLIARQHGWSRGETARAALLAGLGHVTSTLVIGLIVWLAGVAFAARFGHIVSIVSSAALVAFGLWIGFGAWRDLRGESGHHHAHERQHAEHEHEHETSKRTALLLILGSSPMLEGLPAFFAAGKYGAGLIAAMAVVFGISTIATYVLLCVYSTAGLRRVNLGSFEKYGEVASGAFIAVVGLVFLFIPVV